MIEKYFRQYYQAYFVDPLANKLAKWPYLLPVHFTLIGCLIGIFAAVCIGMQWRWTGLILLLVSGYIDTLDGTFARLKKKITPFGCALDIVCDRLVEFSIILGLYEAHLHVSAVYPLFMLGSILVCVSSFLVVGIFSKNKSEKSFHYSPGLIERAEAFIFFVLMILLPSFFAILAGIFSFLVFLTAGIRIYQFYRAEGA